MSESEHGLVPFHVSSISEKVKETAKKELGETEELKNECFQQLRLLIRDHKVASISTDVYLLRFLRFKKFNIQRSFEALRNYATRRTSLLKCALELPTGLIETCFRLNMFGLLPYRDSEERLVYFVRPGFWNPNISSMDEMLTVALLLSSYIATNESSQLTGLVTIFDLTSVPLSYGFHALGSINRWKNFSLIVFHNDFGETFYEYFSPDILPDNFGGTYGELDIEKHVQITKDHLQKMKDDDHYFQHDQ